MQAKTTMAAIGMALAAWMSLADAQPASAPGSGRDAASAPASGPGGRWGAKVTPGWTMMTPQEQEEHRKQMQNVATREECRALMNKHHQQMVDRAKEQGKNLAARPRRMAACEGLPR